MSTGTLVAGPLPKIGRQELSAQTTSSGSMNALAITHLSRFGLPIECGDRIIVFFIAC